jgi:hypothetical protein
MELGGSDDLSVNRDCLGDFADFPEVARERKPIH